MKARCKLSKSSLLPLIGLLVVSDVRHADALATTARTELGLHDPSIVPRLSSSGPLPDENWIQANGRLKDKKCCVVNVANLEAQLKILQETLVVHGPADVDLRARVQTSQSQDVSLEDCQRVLKSVMCDADRGKESKSTITDASVAALHELAQGMAIMASGCGMHGRIGNEQHTGSSVMDVHCRIVCASNYQAREPPFHTDKAPLRGYVTLKGLGTEYMQRACNPLEYLALRMLGDVVAASISNDLRQAKEMEFIVMRGDYYHRHDPLTATTMWERLWTRATACVHRSPPNEEGNCNRRRVIISFDLANGDDDREWFQADKKRGWRNGLTQRKSRLVA